jgi:hypothetical protein
MMKRAKVAACVVGQAFSLRGAFSPAPDGAD